LRAIFLAVAKSGRSQNESSVDPAHRRTRA
jgi:hypothetical protein